MWVWWVTGHALVPTPRYLALQKMPATIKELVESSPFRGNDGIVYIGMNYARKGSVTRHSAAGRGFYVPVVPTVKPTGRIASHPRVYLDSNTHRAQDVADVCAGRPHRDAGA